VAIDLEGAKAQALISFSSLTGKYTRTFFSALRIPVNLIGYSEAGLVKRGKLGSVDALKRSRSYVV
jgi:hypothetical protein